MTVCTHPTEEAQMLVRQLVRVCAFAATLSGVARPAEAQITLFRNPGAFGAGDPLLTFLGVRPFENVTRFGDVGFRTLGLPVGTGIEGAFDPTPRREFGPSEGTILNQYRVETEGLEITLPWSTTRFAFEIELPSSAVGDFAFDLFNGSSMVERFTLPGRTGADYLFYGFGSERAFDRVIFRASGDGRFAMDNLRFAAVPEPAAVHLVWLGILLLTGARRLRPRRPGP
jgi:hypothetical protein